MFQCSKATNRSYVKVFHSYLERKILVSCAKQNYFLVLETPISLVWKFRDKSLDMYPIYIEGEHSCQFLRCRNKAFTVMAPKLRLNTCVFFERWHILGIKMSVTLALSHTYWLLCFMNCDSSEFALMSQWQFYLSCHWINFSDVTRLAEEQLSAF